LRAAARAARLILPPSWRSYAAPPQQLVDPKIKEHRGRTVKNTGDGLLAEFASVVDAVRCAVEVQRGMVDREPGVSDERRIRFRIGINLGDVGEAHCKVEFDRLDGVFK
jgi:class 3 adenylate cyclase